MSQKEKDFAKEECDKIGDWPGCRSLSDASNKFLATAWKQAWEQGECDFEALATRVPGKDAAQLYHMFWQRGWSKKKGKGLREKKQNADVHATKTDTADEGQPSNEAPASASASIRHRSVPLIDKDDLSPHVQEDAHLQQCQQQPMPSRWAPHPSAPPGVSVHTSPATMQAAASEVLPLALGDICTALTLAQTMSKGSKSTHAISYPYLFLVSYAMATSRTTSSCVVPCIIICICMHIHIPSMCTSIYTHINSHARARTHTHTHHSCTRIRTQRYTCTQTLTRINTHTVYIYVYPRADIHVCRCTNALKLSRTFTDFGGEKRPLDFEEPVEGKEDGEGSGSSKRLKSSLACQNFGAITGTLYNTVLR